MRILYIEFYSDPYYLILYQERRGRHSALMSMLVLVYWAGAFGRPIWTYLRPSATAVRGLSYLGTPVLCSFLVAVGLCNSSGKVDGTTSRWGFMQQTGQHGHVFTAGPSLDTEPYFLLSPFWLLLVMHPACCLHSIIQPQPPILFLSPLGHSPALDVLPTVSS